MRVAAYYAPQTDDPLWQAGCRWLGRDPDRGADLAQPDIDDLPSLTAEPRRYGFHATLKPPMKLAGSLDDLTAAAARLAAGRAAFPLPPLRVANVGGFLALVETAPSPALQALADACVIELDAWRAPPDAAELARRRHPGLTARHNELIDRWGYPYVLDGWQFHMTLTRRLTAAEAQRLQPLAEAHFRAALATPRLVEDIALFTEAEAGAPLRLARRLRLRA